MPPVIHPLTRNFIGFGVINVSFAHLFSEAGPEGVSQAYLRRGTVVRIIERRQQLNRGNWESWVFVEGNYTGAGNISRGWLQETNVAIFDTERRANTASARMGQ